MRVQLTHTRERCSPWEPAAAGLGTLLSCALTVCKRGGGAAGLPGPAADGGIFKQHMTASLLASGRGAGDAELAGLQVCACARARAWVTLNKLMALHAFFNSLLLVSVCR